MVQASFFVVLLKVAPFPRPRALWLLTFDSQLVWEDYVNKRGPPNGHLSLCVSCEVAGSCDGQSVQWHIYAVVVLHFLANWSRSWRFWQNSSGLFIVKLGVSVDLIVQGEQIQPFACLSMTFFVLPPLNNTVVTIAFFLKPVPYSTLMSCVALIDPHATDLSLERILKRRQ